jgi:hypothetical protein
MPYVTLLLRLAKIGLFCCPYNPIASEQHSNPAPLPKLVLLQRSAKF